jgi:hypothetical protein
MRRLSNSPAQGSISGFAALSLLTVLSWVKGRNCATTLVGGSGILVSVDFIGVRLYSAVIDRGVSVAEPRFRRDRPVLPKKP